MCPTAPAYTPRVSCSREETSSIARILGAPETVPAGKMERRASNLEWCEEEGRKCQRGRVSGCVIPPAVSSHMLKWRTHLFLPALSIPVILLVK